MLFLEVVFTVMMGLSVAITLGLLPVALAVIGIGKWGGLLYLFYTTWAFKTIVIISAIAGFILGIDKSTTLLGHFWYTERPRNNKISFGLWVGVILVALISYY